MADIAPPSVPTPGLPALLAELSLDRGLALERFPALPRAAQDALLIAAPAELRMELLLVAPACAELIAAMPAPVIAQTVTACEDDADLLLAHADAAQVAAAIDLDCRRRGRIQARRFRRWIGLLVAASCREAAAALREIDIDLLAAGLAPLVRMDPRAGAYVRYSEAYTGTAPILLDDFDCDDEEVWAFLRLLDAEAPDRLAALGAALCARDAEEIANEDYAAYEERMREIGLRDWAQAEEAVSDGLGHVARAALPDEDVGGGDAMAPEAERRFLEDALVAMIGREDCDQRAIDRLSAEIARLTNDAIVAADGGADQARSRAARARVDGLIARGLARVSGCDRARAAELLLRASLGEILRAGRA